MYTLTRRIAAPVMLARAADASPVIIIPLAAAAAARPFRQRDVRAVGGPWAHVHREG